MMSERFECVETGASTITTGFARQREKGSTMVEFAIVVILFLMLLFGIFEFGRALYTYHYLSNAAREATRYALVRGATCTYDNSCTAANSASGVAGATTLADVTDYVKSITPPGINWSNVGVSACGISGGSKCPASPAYCTLNQEGCVVQVTISYTFNYIVPLVHTGSINMASTSEMVIAH